MSLVDDILSQVDIVDVVSSYVNLKKSGRNYIGLCPFHSEKTPSFVVSEEKQIFKCFGCGKWGNVITFVKEIENLDFYDTLKVLAQKANIDINQYKTSFTKNEKELSQKDTLLAINKAALNFFHKQIFENEKALNYLQSERKLDKQTIIKFKLGYAVENSQILIKYLLDKWFKQDDIILSGLARKSSSGSLYSFFTNRIIFPIFNSIGDVVAFSWRIFNWEINTWKYINTPETVVYHKSKILYNYNNAKKTKKDFLIVVEWYMDVIALDRLWYDNAVATCGTALTNQHTKLLKRITKNIVFSFDNDDAWKQASIRWLKIALEEGVYPKIFVLDDVKDFDELVKKWETSLEIFEKSQDALTYFINDILSDFFSSWPIKKQEKIEQIFDLLKSIWNYSIFWDYLEKVAKKINQDVNILYQQIKMNKNTKKYKQQEQQKDDENKYLIPALFYNEFFKQINVDLEEYIWIVLELLDNIDEDNLLKKVILWSLNDKEKEKILEKQLWWEETLSTWTEDKIIKNIAFEVKKYLISLITELIKEKKNVELFEILNKLRKNTW